VQQSNIEGLLSMTQELGVAASGELQCPYLFGIKADSISWLLLKTILVSLSNDRGYVVPRTFDTQIAPCLRLTADVELASARPKLPAEGIELDFARVELVTSGNRWLLLQSAATCLFTVY